MSEAQIINKIESNLYTLYEIMAALSGNLIHTLKEVSWVDCKPQKWPRTIFGTPELTVDFETLVQDIKSKHIPPYWILRRKNDNGIFHQQLKSYGFRLMTQWPGMAVDLTKNDFVPSDIQKVTTPEDINNWVAVVNQTMFNSDTLKNSVIKDALSIKAYKDVFHLYIQKERNKIVSTGLCFDTKDTAGVYMIGTLESHRGKGLASAMTSHMLWEAKNRGLKTAILQATPMGVTLYPKLGFETFCIFDIYWLLGVK